MIFYVAENVKAAPQVTYPEHELVKGANPVVALQALPSQYLVQVPDYEFILSPAIHPLLGPL